MIIQSNKWKNTQAISDALDDHQWISDALRKDTPIPLIEIVNRWPNILSKKQTAQKIAIHCLANHQQSTIDIGLKKSWTNEINKALILWAYMQKSPRKFSIPKSLINPEKTDRHLACITLWATCLNLNNSSIKKSINPILQWTKAYPETLGFRTLIFSHYSKKSPQKIMGNYDQWMAHPFQKNGILFLLEQLLKNSITRERTKEALIKAFYEFDDNPDLYLDLLSIAYHNQCFEELLHGLMIKQTDRNEIYRAYEIIALLKTNQISSAFFRYMDKGHPRHAPENFADILLQYAENIGHTQAIALLFDHIKPDEFNTPWVQLAYKDFSGNITVEEWFEYVKQQKAPLMRYLWGATEALLKTLPSQYSDISEELIQIYQEVANNQALHFIAIAMITRLLYHQRRFFDCIDVFETYLLETFFKAIESDPSTLAKSARVYCQSLIVQNEWRKFTDFWQDLRTNGTLTIIKNVCPYHDFIFFSQLEANKHFPETQAPSLWREWVLRWERMLRLPLEMSQLSILGQRFISIKKDIQQYFDQLDFDILALIDDIRLQIERHIKAVSQSIIDQQSISKSFENRLNNCDLQELIVLINKFE